MTNTSETPVHSFNRPAAVAHEIAYSPTPPPANPVLRGLPLSILSSVVANVGLVQNILWNNAGFDKLRNLPELDGITPRYDPTVIVSNGVATQESTSDHLTTLLNEDFTDRRPSSKVFPSTLDYHQAYAAGKLTPLAVAEALLPLIRRDVEKPSKHSTAFLDSKVDLVLEAARQSTERYAAGKPLSPLDGVPVCVKDEVDLKGYKKTFGTKLDYTNKQDATSYCVEQWLKAGAVIIGKATMHELGLDTSNNNPNYGTPLNPYNDNYYCGGSSGGSAYAVAAGLVPVALGADGGGSIRIPSNYCGLFGLKTSHSRVSGRPSPSLAASTGVLGPIAANMLDLELSFRVMAQPDAQNPISSLFQSPKSSASLPSNRSKILGTCKPWFDRAEPQVQEACHALLTHLTKTQGYQLIDITLPLLAHAQLAHALTILGEISSGTPSVAGLTPANKILISVGNKTPVVDFLQAQKLRNLLMQHLAHLYASHPGLVIVSPTVPDAGWRIAPGDLACGLSDANRSVRNMEFVGLANFTGCPAISVPAGYAAASGSGSDSSHEGKIPVGLMGMAEWCCDEELIAFGYDCEKWLGEGLEGGRPRPSNWVDVFALAGEKGVAK